MSRKITVRTKMLLVIFKLVPLLEEALLSFTEALITKPIQGKTYIRTMA